MYNYLLQDFVRDQIPEGGASFTSLNFLHDKPQQEVKYSEQRTVWFRCAESIVHGSLDAHRDAKRVKIFFLKYVQKYIFFFSKYNFVSVKNLPSIFMYVPTLMCNLNSNAKY